MRAEPFLAAIRQVLEDRPVGRLADPGAPVVDAGGKPGRPASVLVPIFEDAGDLGIVFVKRSDHLGKHAGQIAFPGGGREPCEDELTCALREANEEVGLDPAQVEILGRLDRYTTVTGYLVSPFVGRLATWPLPLVPDPGEVAQILTVPVARLLEPGVLRVAGSATGRVINFFAVGEEVIWGATARILRQLLELATGRALEPAGEVPWDKVRW